MGLSVMRKPSPEQCVYLELFKCGFGLGFWCGFYAFDYLFSFEVFRSSFFPILNFLLCLLVKPETGEEEKKGFNQNAFFFLIYENAK